MRIFLAIAAVVALGATAGRAAAEELAPIAPRLVHAPTAWLQPSGQLHASAAVSHRGGTQAAVALGIGGLAEVDLDLTDRIVACDPCTGERVVTSLAATSALFKIGLASAPAGEHLRGGLALGLRRSFGGRAVTTATGTGALDAAELYLIGGLAWHRVELHAGVELHAARHGDAVLGAARDRVRPLGGLAWTPDPYPRTTLLVDLGWSPTVEQVGPALRWTIGWGVRYQALRWSSIELAVRNREAEALGGATVFVRVNAVLGRPAPR